MHYKTMLGLGIGISAVLVSCAAPPEPIPTGHPSPTWVFTTRDAPSFVGTPVPTKGSFPSVTAGATDWTPDERTELLLGLLEDNGGCSFPCLVGIRQDASLAEGVSAFVDQFPEGTTTNTTIARQEFEDTAGFELIHGSDEEGIRVSFSYYLGQIPDVPEQLVLSIDTWTQDSHEQVPQGGNPSTQIQDSGQFENAIRFYSLQSVLQRQGQPDQVLIGTYPNEEDEPPDMYHPFSLVLIYFDKGFMVEYLSRRQIEQDSFVGCPGDSEVSISTWSSQSRASTADIFHRASAMGYLANFDILIPVQEGSDLSVKAFVDAFGQSSESPCIHTPQERWK